MHRVIQLTPAGVKKVIKSIPGAIGLRDRLYGRPKGQRPAKGSLRPVVYLPTWLEWDVMKQRPQYLLEAFAKAGHPVWFVDPRLKETPERVGKINLVRSLRLTPPSDVILYTHFAPTRTLLGGYKRMAVVYDLLDDLTIYDSEETGLSSERTARHHHDILVHEADVVIVSNPLLIERHRHERADMILVENGVDTMQFVPDGPVADNLPEGPIVGYHGAIAQWFDFDLVAGLAEMRPDLSIVLVGPVNSEVADRASDIAGIANIHLFPAQPTERVVSFVRRFDVGFIPFVVNEMTMAVTPLKMYEYLACQVPVVAAPLPACVAHPSVVTAVDADAFSAAIDDAMSFDSERRAGFRRDAEKASWDQRISILIGRLDELGLRRVP